MADWDSITAAIAAAQSGDPDGRAVLLRQWAATTPEQHAHRCVLAHFLADTQRDVLDELAWDQRALAEHAHVTDADLLPIEVASARGFLPSLHLNVADALRRSGNLQGAGRHLDLALGATDALDDSPYADLVRAGIGRLAERLAQ
ncbi:hypothetical protein [Cumulibacter manganitolerans]|uniref:hypothetical protein n=1 Tax=Cumulibacter manganitolerans TaxID=1884992 RepID=UPI0012955A7B|nr:hypothetical protein [Cumulibacter manganitolerans]